MLRDHVVDEVGRKLKKLGFKRKGTTWRHEGEWGIEVFNIQGSQWGSGAFYLNVGIYLGDDRNLLEPREHECQLRTRIAHEDRSGDEVCEAIRTWFETQTRQLEARARPPASQPVRVKHATFGAGTIVEDRGSTVKVAFDDGSTRVLARSFVEVA